MASKIMNKYMKVITAIIIIIPLLLFYWFELRTSKIRTYCNGRARSEFDWKITENYNLHYQACLHEKGL